MKLYWNPFELPSIEKSWSHCIHYVSEFDSLSLGIGGIGLQPVTWNEHFNLAWMLSAHYLWRKTRVKGRSFSVIYVTWKLCGASVKTIWFVPSVACHHNKGLLSAGGLEGHCLCQRGQRRTWLQLLSSLLKCCSFKDMENRCTHMKKKGLSVTDLWQILLIRHLVQHRTDFLEKNMFDHK